MPRKLRATRKPRKLVATRKPRATREPIEPRSPRDLKAPRESRLLVLPRELEMLNGNIPSDGPQFLDGPNYDIILVRGDDEKTINELQNLGSVICASRVSTSTSNDGDDVIVFVLRNLRKKHA